MHKPLFVDLFLLVGGFPASVRLLEQFQFHDGLRTQHRPPPCFLPRLSRTPGFSSKNNGCTSGLRCCAILSILLLWFFLECPQHEKSLCHRCSSDWLVIAIEEGQHHGLEAKKNRGQKFTDSLDFLVCPKSKSRKLTFVESYQLIDHAKQMQAVDRAHHWNHSSWNPWLRDYVEIWLGYVMLPNSNFLSQQRYALVFWCFKQRVSLLGIPKCCPSSTTFVSAASLHH